MPHIIVKLYPGRNDAQKKEAAQKMTQVLMETLDCKERSISVAFEEVEEENWTQQVYTRDIMAGPGILYKKPGYNPFADAEAEPEIKAQKTPDTLEPTLADHVRQAWQNAANEDTSGMFNPMSWLDTELEDNPGHFDPLFDAAWDSLSDDQKAERCRLIRSVL